LLTAVLLNFPAARHTLTLALLGFVTFLHSGVPQAAYAEDLSVLVPAPGRPQSEEMMRDYLRRLTHEALDRRLKKYESLKTRVEIAEYQQGLKRRFLEQLGEFPEKTPLNARVVGDLSYADYRIEKVIYESQPGFFVTALLFLPVGEPPFPGVLILCGHSDTGKVGYQEVGVYLARNGIAALCPDPIGQGERKQLLDEEGNPYLGPTTEHMVAGIAPILLGRNLASYMIWDGIRGIDYLMSRPDIDPERIGCTGNSGGGNRTSYLMALDDRIDAAAPGCFITTTRLKNESPGPGDAEQNIHAQIAFGMDHPDYILMRAPKPTLILAATRDYVPIEGAWESFRQAKRIYTRLGFPEAVDIVEVDEQHGFSSPLRTGAVRWMRRWLLKMDDAVTEEEQPLETVQALQCTPGTQVLKLPGARSVFDLNIENEQELKEKRRLIWQRNDGAEMRAKIRQIAGIRELQDLQQAEAEERGSVRRDSYRIDKLVLRWEPGIELPALHFVPDRPADKSYLYLHGEGKHVDALPGGPIEMLVRDGHRVLAIDVRGCGETSTTPWRYLNAVDIAGKNIAEFFIAYMLGKSFVGMRAEDTLVAARFLLEQESDGVPQRVHVVAIGDAGPPALHAVALEPELFESVILRRSLSSWANVIHTPITSGVLENVVHGVLKTYDLPDLVALVGPGRVSIDHPVDASGRLVQ
jgi:dienelactone hydrolase